MIKIMPLEKAKEIYTVSINEKKERHIKRMNELFSAIEKIIISNAKANNSYATVCHADLITEDYSFFKKNIKEIIDLLKEQNYKTELISDKNSTFRLKISGWTD